MPRKYSRSAGKDVAREMHKYKRGKLKSGPGGRGGKVKSRRQAIAIGLSEARREGKKVPPKRGSSSRSRSAASRGTASRSTSARRVASSRRSTSRRSSTRR